MFKKTFVAPICIILRLLHHGVAAASSSDVHLKENNLAGPYTLSRNLQHLVATRTCPDLRPQDCICEQRPYKFVFKYTGHACAQSSNFQPDKFTCTGKSIIADANRKGAYLVFSEKEKNNNNAGIVLFQGWVKTGNKFEFDNGGDKFPADMDVNIYSGDDKKFLLQSVRFHSSCSQNLFINDSFGAVELFGFQYERNGPLETCECNTPAPSPSPPTPSPTCGLPTPSTGTDCTCTQSPYKFLFEYTGQTCEDSNNSQGEIFTCTGKSSIANDDRKGAYVVFSEKDNINANGILYENWIQTGKRVEFDNDGKLFPSFMNVKIYSGSDKSYELQSLTFRTSCSPEIMINESFGAVKFSGFQYFEFGNMKTCDCVEFQNPPTPRPTPAPQPSPYPSSTPTSPPTFSPSQYPSSPPTTHPSINPSSSPTPYPSVKPSSAPTTRPSTSPSSHPTTNPSFKPSLTPTAFPSIIPTSSPTSAPTNCPNSICRERAFIMFFVFDALICDASLNTQEDKSSCEDQSSIDSAKSAFVVFSDKGTGGTISRRKAQTLRKGKKGGDYTNDGTTYFSGTISFGAVVEVDNDGSKFPADMDVTIYKDSTKTEILQYVTFHSSCSKNLFLGDRFGSMKIVGFEYKDGDVEKCF